MCNTVVTPNSQQSPWSYCDQYNASAYGTYSNSNSFHPGGVNVLFTDGSVKFVKDSVNQRTWWRSGPAPAVRWQRRQLLMRRAQPRHGYRPDGCKNTERPGRHAGFGRIRQMRTRLSKWAVASRRPSRVKVQAARGGRGA